MRYLKRYNEQDNDLTITLLWAERYNPVGHAEYLHQTTISTVQAAKKEKEPIVLPPEFSEYADVFKKPEVPLPPH